MRHTPRYVAPRPPRPGELVPLGAEDAHHLVRVVRRRAGDPVELIDGEGEIWAASVVATGPPVTVRVEAGRPGPSPSGVALSVGVIEANRMDLLLEKATELGAEQITVVATARARRVPDHDAWGRRAQRLERVARAAVRQSGRARMPLVRGVVPFAEVIEEIPHGEGLIIDPRGDSSLAQALVPPLTTAARTHILVGPEAGFSGDELEAASARGIKGCSLGAAVLRAETAAIVSVGLALAARGALGPRADGREEAASRT